MKYSWLKDYFILFSCILPLTRSQFLDQELNPGPWQSECWVLTTRPPGNSLKESWKYRVLTGQKWVKVYSNNNINNINDTKTYRALSMFQKLCLESHLLLTKTNDAITSIFTYFIIIIPTLHGLQDLLFSFSFFKETLIYFKEIFI